MVIIFNELFILLSLFNSCLVHDLSKTWYLDCTTIIHFHYEYSQFIITIDCIATVKMLLIFTSGLLSGQIYTHVCGTSIVSLIERCPCFRGCQLYIGGVYNMEVGNAH